MKDIKIGFALKKIITNQFSTFETESIDNNQIMLRTGINFGINEENKMMACFTRFEFVFQNSPFIIIDVSCEFQIEDSAWNSFIDDKNEEIIFLQPFMSHLAVITIGTVRGVLHAKTENTVFNQYFLPTINVTEFVKENVSFSLNKR